MNRIGRSKDIDLKNLFSQGAKVPWPSSKHNGFLSYKNCKSLWMLGARTTMSAEDSIKLIEDIITCINVYNYSRKNNLQNENTNNIYIEAYGELTTYLRYLFIYYNSIITDTELKGIQIPFIDYIEEAVKNNDEIIIINYNYDIWLERLLMLRGISFNIEGFENKTDTKIKIIKPHGSISFSFKVKVSGPFTIRKSELDDITQESNQFDITYNLADNYPIVNAIIPPAGDSNRSNMGWIKNLRESVRKNINLAESKDKLIILGISYWPVDRWEIDEIITMMNSAVEVYFINPSPLSCFDAVLTSLFKNYVHYSSSDLLEVDN